MARFSPNHCHPQQPRIKSTLIMVLACTIFTKERIPPGLQQSTDTGSPPFNSSLSSLSSWLKGYMPGLSDRDRARVLSLYPGQGSAEGLSSYNTSYTRAGLIYRDTVLACPAYWMAGAAHNKSYLGEYIISPAKHASDTIYVGFYTPLTRNILTESDSGIKSIQSSRPTLSSTKVMQELLRLSSRPAIRTLIN